MVEQGDYNIFIDHFYYLYESPEVMIGETIPYKGEDKVEHYLYYTRVDKDAEEDNRLGKEASKDL
jgi:hypothetical protein